MVPTKYHYSLPDTAPLWHWDLFDTVNRGGEYLPELTYYGYEFAGPSMGHFVDDIELNAQVVVALLASTKSRSGYQQVSFYAVHDSIWSIGECHNLLRRLATSHARSNYVDDPQDHLRKICYDLGVPVCFVIIAEVRNGESHRNVRLYHPRSPGNMHASDFWPLMLAEL
jgi:hypothetical protein